MPSSRCVQYIKWAGLRSKDEFWSSLRAIGLYKDHIRKVCNEGDSLNARMIELHSSMNSSAQNCALAAPGP